MNEQHIDALPPVQPGSADDSTSVGATAGPVPAGNVQTPSASSPQGGAFVDPTRQPMLPPASTPLGPAGVTAAAGTPPIADDVDLIEKEWVAKAKQIVESTKQDPYQQNEAMTEVKADYLKKRYNRDIKRPNQASES